MESDNIYWEEYKGVENNNDILEMKREASNQNIIFNEV